MSQQAENILKPKDFNWIFNEQEILMAERPQIIHLNQHMEDQPSITQPKKIVTSNHKRLELDVPDPASRTQLQPLRQDQPLKTKVQNLSVICRPF